MDPSARGALRNLMTALGDLTRPRRQLNDTVMDVTRTVIRARDNFVDADACSIALQTDLLHGARNLCAAWTAFAVSVEIAVAAAQNILQYPLAAAAARVAEGTSTAWRATRDGTLTDAAARHAMQVAAARGVGETSIAQRVSGDGTTATPGSVVGAVRPAPMICDRVEDVARRLSEEDKRRLGYLQPHVPIDAQNLNLLPLSHRRPMSSPSSTYFSRADTQSCFYVPFIAAAADTGNESLRRQAHFLRTSFFGAEFWDSSVAHMHLLLTLFDISNIPWTETENGAYIGAGTQEFLLELDEHLMRAAGYDDREGSDLKAKIDAAITLQQEAYRVLCGDGRAFG